MLLSRNGYKRLRERKWQENGEDCVIRSFLTCTVHRIVNTVLKSRRTRWGRYVACITDMISPFKILFRRLWWESSGSGCDELSGYQTLWGRKCISWSSECLLSSQGLYSMELVAGLLQVEKCACNPWPEMQLIFSYLVIRCISYYALHYLNCHVYVESLLML
jgi:hypothetical protein